MRNYLKGDILIQEASSWRWCFPYDKGEASFES